MIFEISFKNQFYINFVKSKKIEISLDFKLKYPRLLRYFTSSKFPDWQA